MLPALRHLLSRRAGSSGTVRRGSVDQRPVVDQYPVLDQHPAVDQHCHSLREDWTTVLGSGDYPGWRACFTEATSEAVLSRGVPYLLAYRRFLVELAAMIGPAAADGAEAASGSIEEFARGERAVAAARDRLAALDPDGGTYLRRLLADAGVTSLLVDTGFGSEGTLGVPELSRVSGGQVREVARLERVAEAVLAAGGPSTRSLSDFVDAVLSRLGTALDNGAAGLKSVLAYRAGLSLPGHSGIALRQAFGLLDRDRQARRFDDPVLVPFLVREAAALAARRGVPLQFHTGFGDTDIDLPAADPALLRPLLRDPATEACPVVLLHCHPYVRGAAYLAGVYPQVYLDLSLAIPLAEPIAATLVGEALALCPASKLLAASDGHSYPEMHWWGWKVWRRALREVLERHIGAGALDETAARELARRILGGNARELYGL